MQEHHGMTEETSIRAALRDDSFHVILTMLWSGSGLLVYEACTRKMGADAKGPSVPIFAYSAHTDALQRSAVSRYEILYRSTTG